MIIDDPILAVKRGKDRYLAALPWSRNGNSLDRCNLNSMIDELQNLVAIKGSSPLRFSETSEECN